MGLAWTLLCDFGRVMRATPALCESAHWSGVSTDVLDAESMAGMLLQAAPATRRIYGADPCVQCAMVRQIRRDVDKKSRVHSRNDTPAAQITIHRECGSYTEYKENSVCGDSGGQNSEVSRECCQHVVGWHGM